MSDLINPHLRSLVKHIYLVVGGSKSPPHVLVVQHLHFESEVLLQVLDDEDEEGQLDAQGLRLIGRTADVGCANVCRLNFQDAGRDVGVRDALDVSIPYCRRNTARYSGGQPTPRKACIYIW